jgi:hypothetical protein
MMNELENIEFTSEISLNGEQILSPFSSPKILSLKKIFYKYLQEHLVYQNLVLIVFKLF